MITRQTAGCLGAAWPGRNAGECQDKGTAPPLSPLPPSKHPLVGEQAQPHLLHRLSQFFTTFLYPLDHAAFCLKHAAMASAVAVHYLSSLACRIPFLILIFARSTKRHGQPASSGEREHPPALAALSPALTAAFVQGSWAYNSFLQPRQLETFLFTPNASLFPQRKTVKVALWGVLNF